MFLIYWLLVLVGFAIDIVFIVFEYQKKMVPAVIFKGLASLFFVALGTYGYINSKSSFALLILLGLIFGLIGDVMLNLRYLVKKEFLVFAGGIGAFLVGHIMYIAELIKYNTSGLYIGISIAIAVVVSVVSITGILKVADTDKKAFKIFGIVYLAIVVSMFAFALTPLVMLKFTLLNVIFAIGAFCFVVSDFILVYFSFGKKIAPLRAINLSMYYLGQILIATCIFIESGLLFTK